jgi:hypothetical protein
VKVNALIKPAVECSKTRPGEYLKYANVNVEIEPAKVNAKNTANLNAQKTATVNAERHANENAPKILLR